MGYKMKGHTLPGIKQKESPIKGTGDNLKRIMAENKAAQKKAGTFYAKGADPNKSSMPKDFNVKGSRTSTTPRYNPNMPKSFNVKGSSASTTPGYSSTKAAKVAKEAKDYTTVRKELGKKISEKNIKVDLKTAKKNFDARQFSKQKGKDFVKNLKTKGDLVSKKPTSIASGTAKAMKNVPAQFAKKASKKALGKLATGVVRKGASRILGGPAGLVAGLAYGAYKSGKKHSGGKAVKGQKSFMADAKKNTKSIYKKK